MDRGLRTLEGMNKLISSLALVLVLTIPACVSPTSPSRATSLSGKTEIPMLVAAGKVAKWDLVRVDFDENARPGYWIAWQNPSRLDGQYDFGVNASAKLPEVPKTFQPDGYSPKTKPIDFSREIFIPAIGRKVTYYCESGATGSENASFSTLPIAWPDGHGGTVYYVISAESDAPEKILSQVKWKKPGSMADAKILDDGTIYR